MNFIRRIFQRKVFRGRGQREPMPLRIEGVRTVLTPEPDDAELAAQALLESMCDGRSKKEEGRRKKEEERGKERQTSSVSHHTSENRDVAYYRTLADRIQAAHAAEARAALRFVAYCELELQKMEEGSGRMEDDHQASAIEHLERGLYRHLDTVEREGGELKRRWQHCLAECVVRQMDMAESSEPETQDT